MNAQNNHVRKSLEKYTFKTTIALSIEAHAELLTKNFSQEESTDKILKFSLDSLNKIYDKPYYDELAMARIKTEKKEAARKPQKLSVEETLLLKNSEFIKTLKSVLGLDKGKSEW